MIRPFIVTAVGGLALALSACGGAEEAEVDVPERGVDVADDQITAEEGAGAGDGLIEEPVAEVSELEE